MELYRRIIDEGIFVFWEAEKNYNYELSIYINNVDQKIRLVNLKIEQGINYYSLKNIGSGNYEIELNVYDGNKLIETVTKEVTLVSNNQRATELLEKLDDISEKLDDVKYASLALSKIAQALNTPEQAINKENWAKFLVRLDKEIDDYRKEIRSWHTI